VRRPVRSAVALILALATAAAPSAAQASQQVQLYKGRTSEGGPAGAYVVKKESGRRVLRAVYAGYELTCSSDGSTQDWGILFGSFPGWNLDDHHRVRLGYNDGTVAIHFSGRLAWGAGTGHTRLVVAELTSDEQPQLCRSSWLGWHVTRRPLRHTTASPSPRSAGFIHVVVRGGVAHLVAFRLPAGV
jgi:hypothetical protein